MSALPACEAIDALLALAKRYASECGECGGTGIVRGRDSVTREYEEAPCEQCEDIRDVIARVGGAA